MKFVETLKEALVKFFSQANFQESALTYMLNEEIVNTELFCTSIFDYSLKSFDIVWFFRILFEIFLQICQCIIFEIIMFSNISHHSRRKLNRNESEEKYDKKRKQYKMMFPLNIKEPNYSLAVSVVTVKTSNI